MFLLKKKGGGAHMCAQGLEAQVCVISSHLIIPCLLGLSLSRGMVISVVPPRLEGPYEMR